MVGYYTHPPIHIAVLHPQPLPITINFLLTNKISKKEIFKNPILFILNYPENSLNQ
jgi:hypothetical protein